MLGIILAAGVPLRAEEPVVTIGKQHAARSATKWVVHETDHALLGPIRFAAGKDAVITSAGSDKVLSQIYISCQKCYGEIAIELTNAPGSDPAGGLRPTQTPRLVCSSLGPAGGSKLVTSDLVAMWEIRPLGDVLTRGLSAAEVRQCVSIEVLPSVALPTGSAQGDQQIATEITPYDRALDSVFVACGETTAYPNAQKAPPAVGPAAKPGPVSEKSQGTAPAAAPWKPARTTAKGNSNVRAAASVDSPLVSTVAPGTRVLVRQAASAWWEVKPPSGAAFHG